MGVNAYFFLIITNIPQANLTMYLVNQNLILVITDKHIFFRKNGSYARKVRKSRPRNNVFFIKKSSKYMDFWL